MLRCLIPAYSIKARHPSAGSNQWFFFGLFEIIKDWGERFLRLILLGNINHVLCLGPANRALAFGLFIG